MFFKKCAWRNALYINIMCYIKYILCMIYYIYIHSPLFLSPPPLPSLSPLFSLPSFPLSNLGDSSKLCIFFPASLFFTPIILHKKVLQMCCRQIGNGRLLWSPGAFLFDHPDVGSLFPIIHRRRFYEEWRLNWVLGWLPLESYSSYVKPYHLHSFVAYIIEQRYLFSFLIWVPWKQLFESAKDVITL